MTSSQEPIACTLSKEGGAQQAQDWATLRAQALSVERRSGGISMTFPARLTEAVEDLAARECECCSFLSINMTRTDDEIRIEISSDNPDALPIVESFPGLIAEVDIR